MTRINKELKIIYEYIEPKTKEEREAQQRDVDAAYDIIFDSILKGKSLREYIAGKRSKKPTIS